MKLRGGAEVADEIMGRPFRKPIFLRYIITTDLRNAERHSASTKVTKAKVIHQVLNYCREKMVFARDPGTIAIWIIGYYESNNKR